ncbi:olfactory receptor 7G2-like [Fukomys damarensis]|uniref:olfactory receptor 7G2-like n=1 Tax=Fukomys damarensis TaxID=885580 RepID=UPI0005402EB8|nr:olfactory receptor 7G2-like [Fukomys damarensis]
MLSARDELSWGRYHCVHPSQKQIIGFPYAGHLLSTFVTETFQNPELQPFIFFLFLVIYLISILDNLLITLTISSYSHLHTPMYFFLSTLSLADICISTKTIPKIHAKSCLLAVLAYDCYVAICQHLSTGHTMLHTLIVPWPSFCTDMETPQFFCELSQIFKLACTGIFINTLLIVSAANIFFDFPSAEIIFSYTKIVSYVFRMPSVGGRYKAFSICGSHLSVVSLFYGSGSGVYLSSAITDSSTKNAVASVIYTVIPQMMNPFIYSLRNREMKIALKHLLIGKPSLFLCH